MKLSSISRDKLLLSPPAFFCYGEIMLPISIRKRTIGKSNIQQNRPP